MSPIAIWAALQNAVLASLQPGSRPTARRRSVGALAVCALYYASRRQARGRRSSVRGFVRSIFPKRILLHPSSLIDMRLWALNGVAFASAYGMLGLGLFFWRDASRRRPDPWVGNARACALAGLDSPRARDRAPAPGLRARLLVRPLLFP